MQGRPFVLEMRHTDLSNAEFEVRPIYPKSIFFQDFGVKSRGAGCVFLQIIQSCIRYIDPYIDNDKKFESKIVKIFLIISFNICFG